ncbi:MAG: hypothetical protein HY608_06815 [Planctomycetes bacterium]|nr:hypothetical protein [Planctomycetota bacterium]
MAKIPDGGNPTKTSKTARAGKGPRVPRQRGAGWRVWGIVLAALLGGLGFALHEPVFYALSMGQLQSDDPDTVVSGRARIGSIETYAKEKILLGCGSDQPMPRRLASVRSLGRWGIPEAVAPCQSAARDAAPLLSEAGIAALGDLLETGGEEVAGNAMHALHEILGATESAGTPLDAASRARVERRLLAVRQLGRVQHEALRRENLAAILLHLQDAVPEIRYVLVDILAGMFESLYDRIEADDRPVRGDVETYLRARGNAKATCGVLVAALDEGGDAKYWTRHQAIDLLRRLTFTTDDDRPFDVYAPTSAQMDAWKRWQSGLAEGYEFPVPPAGAQ